MIIAEKKKKENIAEYLLYMFQVEDLLRGCRFDPAQIEQKLVAKYQVGDELKAEVRKWYAALAQAMQKEGVQEKGHLSFIQKIINALESFHRELLKAEEPKYQEAYKWAKPAIDTLRSKSTDKQMGDVMTCLTGIYGVWLLKLQKKEVSQETEHAISTMSKMLGLLASVYRDFEQGKRTE